MNYIEKNTKILDVGCACGDFGKALKKVKKCTIYGMEYDVQSIKIAQETGSYVDVYQVDLNDFDWSRYSSLEKQFDYIVFGDVLEHILYPQETLNIFKYFLKDTGFFIVSLPNIAHASVKASLLNDEFGYTDTGLLDKTHVKFFTYKSVPKLLGDIGLELKEVMVTPLSIFGSLTNDPYLNMPLEIKDCIFSDPHSFVCQYVMKIAKSSFGKSRTNLNNKKKMEIENDQFPSDIWNLMEGTGIREIKTGLKLRAQELEFREQEFKLMNQEIILMRSSKFWRLRDWYLKFKFLFFSPLKFFKKYFNKLNSGKYHE